MSGKTRSARVQRSAERCSICLSHIRQRSSLDCCQHPFCFSCIQQWSKIENTCPICKRRFQEIRQGSITNLQSRKVNQRRSKIAKVAKKNQQDRHFETFLEGMQQGFMEELSQEFLFLNQLIFEGIQEIDFQQEFDGQETPINQSIS